MLKTSFRPSNKGKKRELSHNEASLVEELLNKNGQAIKGQIETLLKVYSEQVILVHLYARDIAYHDESICQRLKLIDFIDNNYNLIDTEVDENLKVELIKALDNGYDFFSVISPIGTEQSAVIERIKTFATKHNIIFDAIGSNSLAYSCSQLSAALFHTDELLPRLTYWLDKYCHPDAIQNEIEAIIHRKKGTIPFANIEKWELSDREIESISSLVITECHEQVERIYHRFNRYIPTQDYSIKTATVKETSELLENNLQSLGKFDPRYSHQSQTHLVFDTRLLSEGSKEELMKQIENTLFGPKVGSRSGRGAPKQLVLSSDIKALAKWHKNTNVLIKRLDQIPRYIASIIENDLGVTLDQPYKNAEAWYQHVTSKLAEHFDGSETMAMWCTYDEKRTYERFKKRVQYLKFGMSSYRSVCELVASTVGKSKDYPLQSTTYPPLWRPKSFNTVETVARN